MYFILTTFSITVIFFFFVVVIIVKFCNGFLWSLHWKGLKYATPKLFSKGTRPLNGASRLVRVIY